ncbi:MAG: peptidoglycan-binding protein, partial [Candidatus Competibacteraceae bacterium]|nr:peptidoglycan-binding protein [Candidatus Competibacteraceae bacterium]
ARAGKLGQVRQLISKGANVNELDYYGFSPLLLAKLNDHDQTAKLLTSKGASEQLETLVRRLQFYLTELGYSSGGIDGLLGPGTRDAIRAFQRDGNFKVTGRVEEPWVHKLHNKILARVQTDLKKLGFYGGEVDGLVGPATRDSIRSFQQQAGLKINFTPEPDWMRAIQTALQRTSQTQSKPALDANALKTLQEKLLVLGYNPGLPDGLMGSATTQAIRDFQSRYKLSVTGQPQGEWLSVLDREILRTIQQQLTAQGFDAGAADGAYGSRTELAIRKFQQQTGLPVDGRPSAQLISALQKASSRQTASVQPIPVQQAPPKRELIERVQRR